MKGKGLFKIVPPKELIKEIITLLKLDINKIFTKYDINKEKFEEIITWIEPYYIPCKARRFLYDITEDKYITVLRHILRVADYILFSQEKILSGKKQTTYRIISCSMSDLSGSFVMSF